MHNIYPLGHKSSLSLLSSKGKTTSSNLAKFVVFTGHNSSIPLKQGFHLAFAASKKKFTKAVDRNRIKRRFRSALRQELCHFELKENTILMLIIPNKDSFNVDFLELRKILLKALQLVLC